MSQVDDDIVSNRSDNPTLIDVALGRITRRTVLGAGSASAALAMTGGVAALLKAVPAPAQGADRARRLLGFEGIAPSTDDSVKVPRRYTARILIAWGDPVSDGPEFRPDASNSAFEQEWQWGMHNDGIVYFPIGGSSHHGLIVQNHEYTDDVLLFPDGTANWDQEKTNKSLAAHGVGVIEVRKNSNGRWRVVRPSEFARRITGHTPIRIGGPAAGDPRLVTSADPTGKRVLGMLNNCAMGHTPWGHIPRLRGELQRLLPQGRGRTVDAPRTALRAQHQRLRL
jgi:uncharacterized protein